MKVISTHWVNTYCGTVGIVVAEYEHGERKVFTLPISGELSEDEDVELIMKNGSEIRLDALTQIYNERTKKDENKNAK